MELTIKLIALLSLPISLISAWIAYSSREVAKKALEVNLKTYQDRQSSFTIYLVSGNYHIDEKGRRIILLNVSLKNLSDTKNSFFCALEFEYTLPSGAVRKVIVDHDPGALAKKSTLEITPFEKNPRLEEKQTSTSWFCFIEPNNVPEDYRNSRYNIVIKDNKNVEAKQEVYILRAL